MLSPADLLRQAHRRGISVLALTDHDTTLGLDPAQRAADVLEIRLIPGIELSTDVEPGEIHILGYGIDLHSEALQRTLSNLRDARRTRIDRMVALLREIGIDLDRQAIQPNTPGGSIGRPHVAQAMVRAGYVGSIGEAFERYIGNGKPGYLPSQRLSPVEAIHLVRRAGGLPFHAHPLTSPHFPDNLPDLIAAGLVGIEAYYGEYSPAQRREIAVIAAQHHLLVSGGSDYHGEGYKAGRELGGVDLPDDVLTAFLAALDDPARSSAAR
ncbi:MAG: PHP domain-containing protein [Thermomicrobiales bacterium]|nr:PHP domain-containing protein [Thermomicrobiales bacterium]